MNFVTITFQNIKSEIESFLKNEHNKGNILFSPASPYGQILSVIENLHQLSFLYLKSVSIPKYCAVMYPQMKFDAPRAMLYSIGLKLCMETYT